MVSHHGRLITNNQMKGRRHHNNKGARQVRRGKCAAQVKRMATKLGLRFSHS